MAPDFPMKRYRTPWRENASRISSACRYSNAPIPEPIRQVLFAPAPIPFHRVEGAKRGVIENWPVRLDEGIPKPGLQRAPGSRLELLQPVREDGPEELGVLPRILNCHQTCLGGQCLGGQVSSLWFSGMGGWYGTGPTGTIGAWPCLS